MPSKYFYLRLPGFDFLVIAGRSEVRSSVLVRRRRCDSLLRVWHYDGWSHVPSKSLRDGFVGYRVFRRRNKPYGQGAFGVATAFIGKGRYGGYGCADTVGQYVVLQSEWPRDCEVRRPHVGQRQSSVAVMK